jgi:hypothetical protein
LESKDRIYSSSTFRVESTEFDEKYEKIEFTVPVEVFECKGFLD